MRSAVFAVVASVVTLSTIVHGPVAQAAPAVTMSASAATVAPDSTVDLTAQMPVSGAGVVSQEIVQQIDPSKVVLTGLSDITAPVGWELSFCTDACATPPTNFTTTAPTTAAGWAAVRAVRAVGDINSQGEENGKQIATTTTAGTATPLTASFTSVGSSGGDGWDVFFDDIGHIFNIWHHNGRSGQTASTSTQRALDCHTRDGKQCDGLTTGSAWPFQMAPFATRNNSTGWVDVRNQRVWTASIAPGYKPGFVCIDVSDITDPTYCDAKRGGRKFIEAGTSAAPSNSPYGRFDQFTVAGTKLYAIDVTDRVLMCVDTALNNGTGGLCAGQPYSLGDLGLTGWPVGTWSRLSDSGPTGYPLLNAYGTKLYGVTTDETLGATNKFFCWDSTTDAACTGWETPKDLAPSATNYNRPVPTRIYKQVDATGAIQGVCAILYFDSTTPGPCYSPTGASVTANTGLWTVARARATLGLGWAMMDGSRTDHRDTRMIVSKGSCYDMALDAVCPGYRGPASVYTVRFDPDMPDCMWSNQDVGGLIKSYTISTGAQGCATPSTTLVRFSGATIVPRMACATTASGVRAWKNFTLVTPAVTSGTGTLTVSVGGDPVSGWANIPIPAGGVVDLSALSVADTGQTPSFEVSFTSGTTVTSASATITSVGDAPELCMTVTAVPDCPTAAPAPTGPVADAMLASRTGSTTATGSGTAQLSGGTSTPFDPGTATVSITAPSAASCGSTLSGRASDAAAGGGAGVAGVTVSLLDASGNPVTYPADWPDAALIGHPVTTTTDADGYYSFGNLFPGSYKVAFPNVGAGLVQSAQVASGAAGSTTTSQTAAGGVATSGVVVLDAATAGVVNGRYSLNPVARADTSTGMQGVAQTINVQANDSASTGGTIRPLTTKICAGDAAAPCTATTSIVIPGEGVYSVSGSQNVVFTPCSAAGTPSTAGLNCTGPFTGTATPIQYSFTDNAGKTATSTVTPSVVSAPTATADTSTGSWNTPQSATVLTNDTPGGLGGTTYPLDASTMGICASTVSVATSCTGTTLTIAGQGTYTLDRSTGTLTFTPLSTFTGTPTPVKYAVSDSLGQRVISTYQPSVTAPPSPTAADETKLVQPGASVAFTTVTGTGGLGTAGGPPLITANNTTGTGLCPIGTVLPGSVSSCTQTSVTVAGEGAYTLDRTTGVVTYTALAGATGGSKTPVDYVIRDSLTSGGRTNWASGTLTPSIPGPPTLTNDTSTGAWDTAQVIDVLGNDAASVGLSLDRTSVGLCVPALTTPPCSATSVTVPLEGTYTVDAATGLVTFDPLPTFTGTATPVEYTVTQSDGLQASATITPTVSAPAGPTAGDETQVVMPGQTVAFTTLDRSGGLAVPGPPALVAASTCLIVPSSSPAVCDSDGVVTIAGEGTYTLDASTGVVTFAADPSATAGAKTPVDYQVTDALGATDIGRLTPTIPPPPTSLPDASQGEQDQPQTVSPSGNDSPGLVDVPLVPSTVKICAVASPQTTCADTSLAGAHGSFGVNADGSVTFTPDPGWFGSETVAYTVADAEGRVTTNTITFTALPKPAPSAVTDTQTGDYGQVQTFTPLSGTQSGQGDSAGNAPPVSVGTPSGLTTDAGGQTQVDQAVVNIAFGAMKLCAANESVPNCTQTSVTTVDGTYALSGTDVTFTPAAGFIGTATTPVQYQVSNTWDLQSTTVNTKDVTSDPGTAASDQVITCTAPANPDPSTNPCTDWRVVTTTVSATSGTPEVASAYLIPTVNAPAPIAADDETDSGAWNTPVSEDVTVGDTSGATIDVSTVRLCGASDVAPNCTQTSVNVPGEGSYSVDSSGVVTFTPLRTFTGTSSITYSVSDGLGRKASATYSPTIAAPTPPTATDEGQTLLAGGSVSFTTIAESGALVAPGSAGASSVQDGAACLFTPGTTTCDADGVVTTDDGVYVLNPVSGVVTYTANADAPAGANTPVTYRVIDSLGLTATAVLTPTVYERPTVPTKTGTDLTNTAQSFDPLDGDTFATGFDITAGTIRLCDPDLSEVVPDCTAMTVTIAGEGVYTLDPATGVITFTPDTNYVGTAQSVTYMATDGLGQTASATVTPTVVGLPDPAAVNDTASGDSGTVLTFSPAGNDSAGSAAAGSVADLALDTDSIFLCDVAPNLQTPPNCAATTVTTSDGTYVLDPASGDVRFTHAPGFTGTATNPVRYQISNRFLVSGAAGTPQVASAYLIPTIVAPAAAPAPPSNSGSPASTSTPAMSPVAGPAADSGDDCATSRCVPQRDPEPTPTVEDPATGPELQPQKDATVVNTRTPVVLDPLSESRPTPGETFKKASVLIFNGTDWVRKFKDPGVGTWKVVKGSVKFLPAPGFTGKAIVPVRAKDTAGAIARAKLRVLVRPDLAAAAAKPGRKPSVPSSISAGRSADDDKDGAPELRRKSVAASVIEHEAVLTSHPQVGVDCDSSLSGLAIRNVSDTFTTKPRREKATSYRIARKVAVRHADAPTEWIDQTGEPRLAVFACPEINSRSTSLSATPVGGQPRYVNRSGDPSSSMR